MSPIDSPWAKWGRRALTLPLFTALAILALSLAPVWVSLFGLVDLLTGRRNLPRTRALAFFSVYLTCELLGIVTSFLIYLRYPRERGQPWIEANAALQRAWTGALWQAAVTIFRMRVQVEGMEHVTPAPILLFVRHSSTADTVLAAAMVANPHKLLLKYVVKSELLWDPCLDIVGRRLPNAFVHRGKKGRDEVTSVANLAAELDETNAVLIYPEGTRFSARKLEKAIEGLRARSADDPTLEALIPIAQSYRQVLPPKLGGPLALLHTARGVDVVFVEHTGFEGASSFDRFWSGALIDTAVRVRLRRVRGSDIPTEGLDKWLFEQWQQTDRWISDQDRG